MHKEFKNHNLSRSKKNYKTWKKFATASIVAMLATGVGGIESAEATGGQQQNQKQQAKAQTDNIQTPNNKKSQWQKLKAKLIVQNAQDAKTDKNKNNQAQQGKQNRADNNNKIDNHNTDARQVGGNGQASNRNDRNSNNDTNNIERHNDSEPRGSESPQNRQDRTERRGSNDSTSSKNASRGGRDSVEGNDNHNSANSESTRGRGGSRDGGGSNNDRARSESPRSRSNNIDRSDGGDNTNKIDIDGIIEEASRMRGHHLVDAKFSDGQGLWPKQKFTSDSHIWYINGVGVDADIETIVGSINTNGKKIERPFTIKDNKVSIGDIVNEERSWRDKLSKRYSKIVFVTGKPIKTSLQNSDDERGDRSDNELNSVRHGSGKDGGKLPLKIEEGGQLILQGNDYSAVSGIDFSNEKSSLELNATKDLIDIQHVKIKNAEKGNVDVISKAKVNNSFGIQKINLSNQLSIDVENENILLSAAGGHIKFLNDKAALALNMQNNNEGKSITLWGQVLAEATNKGSIEINSLRNNGVVKLDLCELDIGTRDKPLGELKFTMSPEGKIKVHNGKKIYVKSLILDSKGVMANKNQNIDFDVEVDGRADSELKLGRNYTVLFNKDAQFGKITFPEDTSSKITVVSKNDHNTILHLAGNESSHMLGAIELDENAIFRIAVGANAKEDVIVTFKDSLKPLKENYGHFVLASRQKEGVNFKVETAQDSNATLGTESEYLKRLTIVNKSGNTNVNIPVYTNLFTIGGEDASEAPVSSSVSLNQGLNANVLRFLSEGNVLNVNANSNIGRRAFDNEMAKSEQEINIKDGVILTLGSAAHTEHHLNKDYKFLGENSTLRINAKGDKDTSVILTSHIAPNKGKQGIIFLDNKLGKGKKLVVKSDGSNDSEWSLGSAQQSFHKLVITGQENGVQTIIAGSQNGKNKGKEVRLNYVDHLVIRNNAFVSSLTNTASGVPKISLGNNNTKGTLMINNDGAKNIDIVNSKNQIQFENKEGEIIYGSFDGTVDAQLIVQNTLKPNSESQDQKVWGIFGLYNNSDKVVTLTRPDSGVQTLGTPDNRLYQFKPITSGDLVVDIPVYAQEIGVNGNNTDKKGKVIFKHPIITGDSGVMHFFKDAKFSGSGKVEVILEANSEISKIDVENILDKDVQVIITKERKLTLGDKTLSDLDISGNIKFAGKGSTLAVVAPENSGLNVTVQSSLMPETKDTGIMRFVNENEQNDLIVASNPDTGSFSLGAEGNPFDTLEISGVGTTWIKGSESDKEEVKLFFNNLKVENGASLGATNAISNIGSIDVGGLLRLKLDGNDIDWKSKVKFETVDSELCFENISNEDASVNFKVNIEPSAPDTGIISLLSKNGKGRLTLKSPEEGHSLGLGKNTLKKIISSGDDIVLGASLRIVSNEVIVKEGALTGRHESIAKSKIEIGTNDNKAKLILGDTTDCDWELDTNKIFMGHKDSILSLENNGSGNSKFTLIKAPLYFGDDCFGNVNLKSEDNNMQLTVAGVSLGKSPAERLQKLSLEGAGNIDIDLPVFVKDVEVNAEGSDIKFLKGLITGYNNGGIRFTKDNAKVYINADAQISQVDFGGNQNSQLLINKASLVVGDPEILSQQIDNRLRLVSKDSRLILSGVSATDKTTYELTSDFIPNKKNEGIVELHNGRTDNGILVFKSNKDSGPHSLGASSEHRLGELLISGGEVYIAGKQDGKEEVNLFLDNLTIGENASFSNTPDLSNVKNIKLFNDFNINVTDKTEFGSNVTFGDLQKQKELCFTNKSEPAENVYVIFTKNTHINQGIVSFISENDKWMHATANEDGIQLGNPEGDKLHLIYTKGKVALRENLKIGAETIHARSGTLTMSNETAGASQILIGNNKDTETEAHVILRDVDATEGADWTITGKILFNTSDSTLTFNATQKNNFKLGKAVSGSGDKDDVFGNVIFNTEMHKNTVTSLDGAGSLGVDEKHRLKTVTFTGKQGAKVGVPIFAKDVKIGDDVRFLQGLTTGEGGQITFTDTVEVFVDSNAQVPQVHFGVYEDSKIIMADKATFTMGDVDLATYDVHGSQMILDGNTSKLKLTAQGQIANGANTEIILKSRLVPTKSNEGIVELHNGRTDGGGLVFKSNGDGQSDPYSLGKNEDHRLGELVISGGQIHVEGNNNSGVQLFLNNLTIKKGAELSTNAGLGNVNNVSLFGKFGIIVTQNLDFGIQKIEFKDQKAEICFTNKSNADKSVIFKNSVVPERNGNGVLSFISENGKKLTAQAQAGVHLGNPNPNGNKFGLIYTKGTVELDSSLSIGANEIQAKSGKLTMENTTAGRSQLIVGDNDGGIISNATVILNDTQQGDDWKIENILFKTEDSTVEFTATQANNFQLRKNVNIGGNQDPFGNVIFNSTNQNLKISGEGSLGVAADRRLKTLTFNGNMQSNIEVPVFVQRLNVGSNVTFKERLTIGQDGEITFLNDNITVNINKDLEVLQVNFGDHNDSKLFMRNGSLTIGNDATQNQKIDHRIILSGENSTLILPLHAVDKNSTYKLTGNFIPQEAKEGILELRNSGEHEAIVRSEGNKFYSLGSAEKYLGELVISKGKVHVEGNNNGGVKLFLSNLTIEENAEFSTSTSLKNIDNINLSGILGLSVVKDEFKFGGKTIKFTGQKGEICFINEYGADASVVFFNNVAPETDGNGVLSFVSSNDTKLTATAKENGIQLGNPNGKKFGLIYTKGAVELDSKLAIGANTIHAKSGTLTMENGTAGSAQLVVGSDGNDATMILSDVDAAAGANWKIEKNILFKTEDSTVEFAATQANNFELAKGVNIVGDEDKFGKVIFNSKNSALNISGDGSLGKSSQHRLEKATFNGRAGATIDVPVFAKIIDVNVEPSQVNTSVVRFAKTVSTGSDGVMTLLKKANMHLDKGGDFGTIDFSGKNSTINVTGILKVAQLIDSTGDKRGKLVFSESNGGLIGGNTIENGIASLDANMDGGSFTIGGKFDIQKINIKGQGDLIIDHGTVLKANIRDVDDTGNLNKVTNLKFLGSATIDGELQTVDNIIIEGEEGKIVDISENIITNHLGGVVFNNTGRLKLSGHSFIDVDGKSVIFNADGTLELHGDRDHYITVNIAEKSNGLGTVAISGAGKTKFNGSIGNIDGSSKLKALEILSAGKVELNDDVNVGTLDLRSATTVTVGKEKILNVTSFIASGDGTNSIVKFLGSGTLSGVNDFENSIAMLQVGLGDVTIDGTYQIDEVQTQGTGNTIFKDNSYLFGGIDITSGNCGDLMFKGSSTITGEVGTGIAVGNIHIQGDVGKTVDFQGDVHIKEDLIFKTSSGDILGATAKFAKHLTTDNIRFDTDGILEIYGNSDHNIKGYIVIADKVGGLGTIRMADSVTNGKVVTIEGNIGDNAQDNEKLKKLAIDSDGTVHLKGQKGHIAEIAFTKDGKVVFDSKDGQYRIAGMTSKDCKGSIEVKNDITFLNKGTTQQVDFGSPDAPLKEFNFAGDAVVVVDDGINLYFKELKSNDKTTKLKFEGKSILDAKIDDGNNFTIELSSNNSDLELKKNISVKNILLDQNSILRVGTDITNLQAKAIELSVANNDSRIILNNKNSLTIDTKIGVNDVNPISTMELNGGDVTLVQDTFFMKNLEFNNSDGTKLVTKGVDLGKTNISNKGDKTNHLIQVSDADQNISGAIGSQENPFGKIEILSDNIINIYTTTFFADILTPSGAGTVNFNAGGGIAQNIGASDQIVGTLNFNGSTTVSGDIYAKNMNVIDNGDPNTNHSFLGKVNASQLTVGDKSLFDGDVTANNLNIAGVSTFNSTVTGDIIDIKADTKFNSGVTGFEDNDAIKVQGDVNAQFNGTLTADNIRLFDENSTVTFTDDFKLDTEIVADDKSKGIAHFKGNADINKNIGELGKHLNRIEFIANDTSKIVNLKANLFADQVVFNKVTVHPMKSDLEIQCNVNATDTIFDLGTKTLNFGNGNVTFANTITINTTIDGANAGKLFFGDNIDAFNIDGVSFVINGKVGVAPQANTPITLINGSAATNTNGTPASISINIPNWEQEFDEQGNLIITSPADDPVIPPADDPVTPPTTDPNTPITPTTNVAELPASTDTTTIDAITDVGAAAGGVTDGATDGSLASIISPLTAPSLLDSSATNSASNNNAPAVAEHAFTGTIEPVHDLVISDRLVHRDADAVLADAGDGELTFANNDYDTESGVSAGSTDHKHGLWVHPFVGSGKQKQRGSSSGFSTKQYGGVIGFDTQLSENLTMGITGAITETKYDHKDNNSSDKTDVTTLLCSIYGLYEITNNWFVNGVLTYGNSEIKTKHQRIFDNNFVLAKGKHTAHSVAGELLTGYHYKLSHKLVATPLIGFDYGWSDSNAFKETGAADQNSKVSSHNAQKIKAVLGLRFTTPGFNIGNKMKFLPKAHAFVRHDLRDEKHSVDISFDSQEGTAVTKEARTKRTSANIGVGFDIHHGMVEYGASYQATLSEKYVGHQGTLKLRVNF